MGDKLAQILTGDARGTAQAAEMLREGRIVALPTETVYGLAARADSADAVAKIYRAKGRPEFNPLIVHVGSLAQAERYARFDARARELARDFWPGSLTMVLPARSDSPIAPAVTAGLPTIALRMPAHELTLSLLAVTDLPLAAPSANPSGSVSPTQVAHVMQGIGTAIDAVLDGGDCRAGLESTIVALREYDSWEILRPGPVSAAMLVQVMGSSPRRGGLAIEAPGQLAQHYAPGKPVRLEAVRPEADEYMIGFGTIEGDCTLSASADLAEAAAQLYACLHLAAASELPRIAVAPIPADGMGEAIRDRLARASA